LVVPINRAPENPDTKIYIFVLYPNTDAIKNVKLISDVINIAKNHIIMAKTVTIITTAKIHTNVHNYVISATTNVL
jgi:hypothetical protein